MSIGERITELRKSEHISQVQLAKCLGVSRQAVSKWETGLSLPDSQNMILLAEVLKTDVEYLTTGRKNDAIRPPVILKTVETVEVPVVQVVEKPVTIEKIIEVPVIQYVEKPVTKKVLRVITRRNPIEYLIVGVVCFLLGILIGILV